MGSMPPTTPIGRPKARHPRNGSICEGAALGCDGFAFQAASNNSLSEEHFQIAPTENRSDSFVMSSK